MESSDRILSFCNGGHQLIELKSLHVHESHKMNERASVKPLNLYWIIAQRSTILILSIYDCISNCKEAMWRARIALMSILSFKDRTRYVCGEDRFGGGYQKIHVRWCTFGQKISSSNPIYVLVPGRHLDLIKDYINSKTMRKRITYKDVIYKSSTYCISISYHTLSTGHSMEPTASECL
eukprot:486132_1